MECFLNDLFHVLKEGLGPSAFRPAHSHQSLGILLEEAGPRLTQISIKGPYVSHFELAPAIDLETPISLRLSKQLPIQTLHIVGNFANSVYCQLHTVLPALGRMGLKELKIGNVHPWSRVMTAAQVRRRGDNGCAPKSPIHQNSIGNIQISQIRSLPEHLPSLSTLHFPFGAMGEEKDSLADWWA